MPPGAGRFQPVDRLLRSVEFQHVIRRGRRMAGTGFVVVASERTDAPESARQNRLGITVSRKVGCAVVRNRVKRRIREWFRTGRGELGTSIDLVVIGRAAAASLTPTAFAAELTRLAGGAARSARVGGAT